METIFCGAKKMADDATTMADSLLGAYVSNHINWAYTWLRPSVRDIVCGYLALHGNQEDVSQTDLANLPGVEILMEDGDGDGDADADAGEALDDDFIGYSKC